MNFEFARNQLISANECCISSFKESILLLNQAVASYLWPNSRYECRFLSYRFGLHIKSIKSSFTIMGYANIIIFWLQSIFLTGYSGFYTGCIFALLINNETEFIPSISITIDTRLLNLVSFPVIPAKGPFTILAKSPSIIFFLPGNTDI